MPTGSTTGEQRAGSATQESRARYVRLSRRLLRCAGATVVVTHPAASPLVSAVSSRGVVLVPDAARTPELAEEAAALVGRPVGALLAVPLAHGGGPVVGALVVIETEERAWDDTAVAMLRDLAAGCAAELAAADLRAQQDRALADADEVTQHSRALLSLSEGLSATRTVPDVAHVVEMVGLIQLGCSHVALWLRDGDELVRAAPRGPHAPPEERLPLDPDHPLGAVALSPHPVAVRRRSELERRFGVNDDLRCGPGRGARLFLPLVQGQAVAGTLLLAWDSARDVRPDERPVLDALASYTAQALQRAELVQERQAAMLTLQRSLLPTIPQLPGLPGLEVCARYRPAAAYDQVGGDWYDAVPLPDGGAVAVVGDVIGHDIRAAATMGQLRTMLRTLAWAEATTPARTLERLDEALAALDLPALATLVLARIGPLDHGRLEVVWSNAGHPPPMIAAADGTTRVLEEGEPDLLLGVQTGLPRLDHRTVLEPGSLLVLYTDGLVEHSGEHIDVGTERLRAAVESQAAAHLDGKLEELVDAVLDQLLGTRQRDDVAVLAVRVPPA